MDFSKFVKILKYKHKINIYYVSFIFFLFNMKINFASTINIIREYERIFQKIVFGSNLFKYMNKVIFIKNQRKLKKINII